MVEASAAVALPVSVRRRGQKSPIPRDEREISQVGLVGEGGLEERGIEVVLEGFADFAGLGTGALAFDPLRFLGAAAFLASPPYRGKARKFPTASLVRNARS